MLAAVGTALQACIRTSDFAGRFGGEEFVVLLPGTTAEGAVIVAEKMRHAVASLVVPGVGREITISIGLADLLQHGGSASELIRQADRVLYAAKAGGRNRTAVATLDTDGGRATLDQLAIDG